MVLVKNPHHAKPEINSGEEKVEKAGYIPANRRIEAMIDAGERLAQARMEQYDGHDTLDPDDMEVDPTRNPGFDPADAAQLSLRLSAIAKEKRKDQDKLKEERKLEAEQDRIAGEKARIAKIEGEKA